VPAPRKHSQEMRERAQRMVREARAREPGLSVNGACKRIGPQLGILPDTLPGWCKQTSIDRGETPGTTTEDAKRIRELERENRELRRANEILQTASAFSPRRSSTAVCADRDYIDQHRDRFGVEPICRALREQGIQVAPSGYRTHQCRLPSRRALRDAAVSEIIEATFWDPAKGRGVYGVRKMWHQLRRDDRRLGRRAASGPAGAPRRSGSRGWGLGYDRSPRQASHPVLVAPSVRPRSPTPAGPRTPRAPPRPARTR